VSGLPIPSTIPGMGGLANYLEEYTELFNCELDGTQKSHYAAKYGPTKDGAEPTMSDLVGGVLTDDAGGQTVTASRDGAPEGGGSYAVGEAYKALSKMLDSIDWKNPSHGFDLSRYVKGHDEVVWMCSAHAASLKYERFIGV
jgi:hypothetical protein